MRRPLSGVKRIHSRNARFGAIIGPMPAQFRATRCPS